MNASSLVRARSSPWCPGWLGRALGVFAPEASRPDLRLALRGILGLMVPLLLGRAFGLPRLDLVGIAAFLLTFGDITGVEEPRQSARLAFGALLSAAALATGVLTGIHLVPAILGMAVWGVLAGLLGAYGNAGAALALPVVWAYVELGLTAPIHDIRQAVLLAALYLAGGVWAIVLAAAIKAADPHGPFQDSAAACYDRLAHYLDAISGEGTCRPATADIAPETQVRQAIARARALATLTCRRQRGPGDTGQRLTALIELADQLFSRIAALGDLRAGASRGSSVPQDRLTRRALQTLPAMIARRSGQAGGLALVAPLERLADQAPTDEAARLQIRIADSLSSALQLAAGHAGPMVPAASTPPEPERAKGVGPVLAPLRTCMDRRSVVLRHALRFGLLTALAVAVARLWHPPFGYWIPLTVSVVLKPYAGLTLTRGAQRLVGTMLGVALGLALTAAMDGWLALTALTACLFFVLLAVLPINYGWAVLFLSAGVVPYETLLTGDVDWRIGLLRILHTVCGGAIALLGGCLLWPIRERDTLPAALAAALRATACYAGIVLRANAAADELAAAHHEAGLANSNLQALIQRTLPELAHDPVRAHSHLAVAAILQQMMLSLNTLRVVGPAPGLAPPQARSLAAEAEAALQQFGAAIDHHTPLEPPEGLASAWRAMRSAAMPDPGVSSVGQAVGRTVRQILALYPAVARLARP